MLRNKSDLTVAKFGGTSLADADRYRNAADIISRDPARKIIVVSAPGKRSSGVITADSGKERSGSEDIKITDLLLEAGRDDDKYDTNLRTVAQRYREIAGMQLKAWNEAAGWFYWNYQLLRDRNIPTDEPWKESWDLSRCIRNGWLTESMLK